MKKKLLKKALSLILSLVFAVGVIPAFNVANAGDVKDYTGCMVQHDPTWAEYTVNGGTMSGTACGIFSLINCVGYLTGRTIDIYEAATWAHNVGGFNVNGGDGTYRLDLYPLVEAKYGKEYNITVDCGSDNNGYWEDASSMRLKNHILNGGVAIAHVPGHFIAVVGYDKASGKYHVYDSSPSGKRGTNVNGGDLWVSENALSLNVFRLDWFCLLSSNEKDKTKPSVSNVTYSEVSSKGYTISCTATDDYYVGNVAFAVWTEKDGKDDLNENYTVAQAGSRKGNTFTFRVDASRHNNETDGYVTHIYATDRGGNVTRLEVPTINISDDGENPVISDIKVTNRTEKGYTVSCKVADNWGVNKVAFPTWTSEHGQDDLDRDYMSNALGSKDGDTYTFEVSVSDHKDETGNYITHIYALDCAGNTTSCEVGIVEVADPKSNILLVAPTTYSVEGDVLNGVKSQTAVEYLLSQFENETLLINDKSGNAVESSAFITNGSKISLLDGETLLDSLTVIIMGDVNCNGIVDIEDLNTLKNAFLENKTFEGVEKTAVDFDENETLDCTDYMNLKVETSSEIK